MTENEQLKILSGKRLGEEKMWPYVQGASGLQQQRNAVAKGFTIPENKLIERANLTHDPSLRFRVDANAPSGTS